MKTKIKIIFVFALLNLCLNISRINAADIYISNYGDGTASLVNATAAYRSALAGDTIVFPPNGNAIWAAEMTISKAINIMGNGTILTAAGSLSNGFFNISGLTSTSLLRISGFQFQMNNHMTTCAIKFSEGSNSLTQIRIDHNKFYFGQKQILLYTGKGLVDNNYFYNGIFAIEFTAGSNAAAHASWESMEAGTADGMFIEDNFFIDDAKYPSTTTQEKIGTYNGGKLVVRYNNFDFTQVLHDTTCTPVETHGNALGGAHGSDPSYGYWQRDISAAGARRGQSVVEIYNNIMKGKRIDFPAVLRGSANLVYNNAIVGKVANTPRFRLREEEMYEKSNWSPVRNSCPAEDQIHNSFFWNNTYNGMQMSGDSYFAVETCINLNQEYFRHAPCGASDRNDQYGNVCTYGKSIFTGRNGASGSYPTDGIKYPTYGTMIFNPVGDNAYYGYSAYIYPHPLADEGVIRAPANVRLVY